MKHFPDSYISKGGFLRFTNVPLLCQISLTVWEEKKTCANICVSRSYYRLPSVSPRFTDH